VTPTALDAGELDLVLGPVHADLPCARRRADDDIR